MTLLQSFYKYLGSFFISLGILAVIGILMLSSIDNEMKNADVVTKEVVNSFFLDHKDELLGMQDQNVQYLEFVQKCESGEINEKDCDILNDESIFQEQLNENSNVIVDELKNLYAPFGFYLSYIYVVLFLALILMMLGSWLIFHGLDHDLHKFFQSISFRLWFGLLIFLLTFWYFVGLTPESFVDKFNPGVTDFPQLFVIFSVSLLFAILQPAVQKFIVPLLIIVISFFVLWLVSLFYIYRNKKKSVSKRKRH